MTADLSPSIPRITPAGACVPRPPGVPDARHGSVYCRVLACDFDGTLADGGRLAPEVSETLSTARAQGLVVVLVTGRVLEDLQVAGVELGLFDAVVAENGAVISFPARSRQIRLGDPPPERFLRELRGRGIPFHMGTVVVGCAESHATQLQEILRACALDCQLTFNRQALMLLPSGVNKATGVRRALEELGRSEHNMIAFGDAENDLPLLLAAQLGVAARGAVPALREIADDCLTLPNGAGVAHYVARLLERGGVASTSARIDIAIGRDTDGAPLALPATGLNVMVTGDPRSGKSWLAGLVAEKLLDAGYRFCILDPEGDHLAVGTRPHTLAFGHALALPDPDMLPTILRTTSLNLVLNLAALPHPAKLAYADRALCALQRGRSETGIPHWIIVDEAHYFCHERSACVCARRFDGRTGNFLFVTYRPSLVAGSIHDDVGAYLIGPTTIEDERYFMASLLRATAPSNGTPESLTQLSRGLVGLLRVDGATPPWQMLVPLERVSSHAHHGRKYADTWLSDEKAFHFLAGDGTTTHAAHNVVEFCEALRAVPPDTLRHHLLHGDFARWVGDVLGDDELRAGLKKLEETTRDGATPDRNEIIAHVRDRYFV